MFKTRSSKHPLAIGKVEVEDSDYVSETPERLRNKDFPGFPSCSVFLGKPGSGKTNTFIYMLKSPLFWNKFFDKIYLMGPTTQSDKMYKQIKVPEDQVCSDQDLFIPRLEEWVEEQKAEVDSDPKGAPKCLFVFEDITSYFDHVQKTPAFGRCYTQIRHLKSSAVAMVHKYKKFNTTARAASRHLLIWECNKSEQKQIYEDYGPSSLTLNEWYGLMRYCHEPTEQDPKPFLYINTMVPEKIRFRKGFYEILKLNDAADEGNALIQRDDVGKPGRKSKRRFEEEKEEKSAKRVSHFPDGGRGTQKGVENI